MKKNKKSFVLCLFVLFLLISCSTSISSTPEWTTPTKGDLIGIWVAEFYSNGAHDTNTIFVGSNYSGYLQMEEDYSGTSQEYQNQIPTIVTYLENSGYSCTNNSSEKQLTAILNFSSSDLDLFISETQMKINSSKNRIKVTSSGNTAEYVKQ